MELFLVYEVDTDSWSGGRPASAKDGQAGLTPIPMGCYFALDTGAACEMAAEQHGRPGLFAAVEATVHNLTFTAGPFTDQDAKKLKKKLKKRKKRGG